MDLYFHTSPKKRMLTSFKKKRIGSSTVAPQEQQPSTSKLSLVYSKSTPIQYFQKKVSLKQAKKILQKMVPRKRPQKSIVSAQDSINSSSKHPSTVLFDSNEDLHTPPTPPPKKSETMPNLSSLTSSQEVLVHRALPSLPSVASYTSSLDNQKKNGLTRATSWVGNSIHKWLSSAEAKERRKMAILMDHSVLDEDEESTHLQLKNKVASN